MACVQIKQYNPETTIACLPMVLGKLFYDTVRYSYHFREYGFSPTRALSLATTIPVLSPRGRRDDKREKSRSVMTSSLISLRFMFPDLSFFSLLELQVASLPVDGVFRKSNKRFQVC